MANSTQAPSISTYGEQNGAAFYTSSVRAPPLLQSLSPESLQKMKYKIALDKQVTEKQKRLAHEWEKKIERDKKYVQQSPFVRQNRTTIIDKQELEEILTKGRAPSPVLDPPPQYVLHHQARTTETVVPSDSLSARMNGSTYDKYAPHPTHSSTQPQISNNNFEFQRFYGPTGNGNANEVMSSTSQSTKGDAHDPFSSFDPTKDGQNVFNSNPQHDFYDPWGRPGAGAPLVYAPTGQKYTRYSGSLQDKLHRSGPLGYHQNQYIYNIEDQKRDLESEQKRRQQEELELRAHAGNTAEWISQLNKTNYPLKAYSPAKDATREKLTDPRTRHRTEENRVLHDDLVRQAEERARLQKLNRRESNMAELQHTQAMNNWWGRGGSGAPSMTNRRHNVQNSFEHSRQKWGTNHLGQLVAIDDGAANRVQVQTADFFYPRNKQFSNHRNFYESVDDSA